MGLIFIRCDLPNDLTKLSEIFDITHRQKKSKNCTMFIVHIHNLIIKRGQKNAGVTGTMNYNLNLVR